MNRYIGYYKGKEEIVDAKTSYEAQMKAAKLFGAKKSWDVVVMLYSKDGEVVEHTCDK